MPLSPPAFPTQEFTAAELENSFPLDRGRRFRSEAGRELVRFVVSAMDEKDRRQRRRRVSADVRRQASIEAVLANIVAAHLNRVDATRFVAVSFKRSDYVLSDLSRDGLAECRDYILTAGWIEGTRGFLKAEVHDDKRLGRVTRVRATSKLRDIIDSAELGRRPLTIAANQLVRINKPVNGLEAMPAHVADSRRVIEAVNRRLAATDITVGTEVARLLTSRRVDNEGEDEEGRERKLRYAGDMTATSIYRAFKYDWGSGGRFYGGWWMSFPRGLRPYIKIDEQPVVELDYGTLHPLLLYRRANLDLHFDPYLVPPWQGRTMRELGKRTFNRLLNRAVPDPAKRLDLRAAKGDSEALPPRITFAKYRDELVYNLRGIERWFGTGEGLCLQYEDSELALSVMAAMEAEAVPVLPIHDSFIVPSQHEEQLRLAMLDAFFSRYEDVPLIDRKGPPPSTVSDPTTVHNWVE